MCLEGLQICIILTRYWYSGRPGKSFIAKSLPFSLAPLSLSFFHSLSISAFLTLSLFPFTLSPSPSPWAIFLFFSFSSSLPHSAFLFRPSQSFFFIPYFSVLLQSPSVCLHTKILIYSVFFSNSRPHCLCICLPLSLPLCLLIAFSSSFHLPIYFFICKSLYLHFFFSFLFLLPPFSPYLSLRPSSSLLQFLIILFSVFQLPT